MTYTCPESIIAVNRPLCPMCRGDGVILRGATIARCPECEAREWEEFNRGLKDHPPCFGYASCAPKVMRKCPWGEGCKEGVLRC